MADIKRKGSLAAPFTLHSSSATGGYIDNFASESGISNRDVGNLHHDGTFIESGMQGPFAKAHVGGMTHRHVALNSGSDDESNRGEAFRIVLSSSFGIRVRPAKYTSNDTLNMHLPTLAWSREPFAKSPVNIKNIKWSTGSARIGNYQRENEIVFMGSRTNNNPHFVDNGGYVALSATIDPFIENVASYAKPQRGTHRQIMVCRFSAPGGVETGGDADGGAGLDVEAAEFSPYNALPYRNLMVRQYGQNGGLRGLLARHSPQFGSSSAYVSIHKVQRNRLQRYENSGSTTVLTSSFDNGFISHAIPRTTRAYWWITGSFLTGPFGHPTSSTDFTFVSSSDQDFSQAPLFTTTYRNDTIGLNQTNYVPITASLNLLGRNDLNDETALGNLTTLFYNSDFNTIGGFGEPTSPQKNTAYFQEKFGPFGWPTWKQVRVGEHPVARNHRLNNVLSVTSSFKEVRIGANGFLPVRGIKRRNLKQFTEPVISSKDGTIEHRFKNVNSDDEFVVKYPHGNNFTFFANEELNSLCGLENNKENFYDKMTKQYLKGSDQFGLKKPRTFKFISLKTKEKVWPSMLNEGLQKVLDRDLFTIQYWSPLRADRTVLTSSNSHAETISASSIWPLDARENFATGVSYTAYTQNNNSIPTNSCGELQNPYSTFHNDPTHTAAGVIVENLRLGALYNRRMPVATWATSLVGGASIVGDPLFYDPALYANTGSVVFAGDTFWETPSQRGKEPFHFTSYQECANQIRRQGKDHSIIPEFRISEHLENYVASGSSAINSFAGIFTITGSSNDATVVVSSVMTSDDADRMVDVAQDHDGYQKKLTVSCDGLLKFLPYKGLYPADRTIEIAELFKKGYYDFFQNSSSAPGIINQVYRNLSSIFIAPGILFNSIKSGLAVSYPYSENPFPTALNEETTTISPAITLVDLDDYVAGTDYNFRTPTAPYPAWERLVGSPLKIAPFESLLNPEQEFLNRLIWDIEPHNSASIEDTSAIVKNPLANSGKLEGVDEKYAKLYKAAISNFLAETIKFFAPNERLASHFSLPDNNPSFGNVDATKNLYLMDYVLYNTVIPGAGAHDYRNNPGAVPAVIYSNHASFGPPLDFSYTAVSAGQVTASAFTAFTPPYADGAARARFIFRPFKSNDTRYTLDEIFSNITVEQYRPIIPGEPADATNDDWAPTEWEPLVKSEFTDLGAYKYKMVPSSSVNLLTRTKLKKVEYEALTGTPQAIQEPESGFNVWVIEPKWQSPAFDHSYKASDITTPLSGAGALSYGVWHQYPRDVNSAKGIYSQVSFGAITGSNSIDTSTTGSLAELVGFDTAPKRIGDVADSKLIEEAIVAIPYYEKGNERFFYWLDKAKVGSALIGSRELIDYGDSIKHMVDTMQKYILPPHLDFVNNSSVDPFAMYFFEFTAELSRNDLIDIWYNLPPKLHIDHQKQNRTLSHPLNDNELISELKDNTKWIVFKVKKRGEFNYFKLTADQKDDERFQFQIGSERDGKNKATPYSYNWPYDFFSIVELGKINVELMISGNS
jgi:hypothetical protein